MGHGMMGSRYGRVRIIRSQHDWVLVFFEKNTMG